MAAWHIKTANDFIARIKNPKTLTFGFLNERQNAYIMPPIGL